MRFPTQMRSLALVAFVIVLHAGCSSAAAEPSSHGSSVRRPPSPAVTAEPRLPRPRVEPTPVPNLQTGVTSENGLFRASWQSRPEAPAINEVHEWVLHIETADGEPAAGASSPSTATCRRTGMACRRSRR